MMYLVVGTATLGLIYFVCTTFNAGLGLLVSPLIGVAAHLYWQLIDPDQTGQRAHLRVVSTSALGPALALVASRLTGLGGDDRFLVAGGGVLVGAVVSSALFSWRAQSGTVTCVLCHEGAGGRRGFDCPRCGDRVCTRTTCWNPRYARCTRCHQRGVPIFPIAEKWWVARLGRRVMKGECLSCYVEAQEGDLRECGQCHWSMCRRCWDHYNGICQRCEWVMPDLPPTLVPFLRRPRSRSERRQRGRPSAGTDRSREPRPLDGSSPPGRPARPSTTDASDDTIKNPPRR